MKRTEYIDKITYLIKKYGDQLFHYEDNGNIVYSAEYNNNQLKFWVKPDFSFGNELTKNDLNDFLEQLQQAIKYQLGENIRLSQEILIDSVQQFNEFDKETQ